MSSRRTIRALPLETRSRYTTKYHALAHIAWKVESARLGLNYADRGAEEHWRRTELHNKAGVESVLDLDPSKGFDGAMLHFAQIAGDDKLMEKYSTGDERRVRYLIDRQLETIARLEQRVVTWDYVRSIAMRMHLPAQIDDCPAEHLVKLQRVLDIHIWRVRADAEAPLPAGEDYPF